MLKDLLHTAVTTFLIIGELSLSIVFSNMANYPTTGRRCSRMNASGKQFHAGLKRNLKKFHGLVHNPYLAIRKKKWG